jgi:hypothetical protein
VARHAHNGRVDLAALIADPRAGIADIAAYLDGLGAAGRWGQVRRLDRDQQRLLYRRAEGTDVDLVGAAGTRVEVIHDGMNTLPVPALLRRFQKRFCRPDGDADRGDELFGYNEGPTRRLIGPGYFVATTTARRAGEHPGWPAYGGVVVDYHRVPDGAVVDGWPPVVPNSRGLQRFVFHETRDFIRGVSRQVSIGAAFKRDKPLDHYFILCRRDPN